jgi:hypothetical protein
MSNEDSYTMGEFFHDVREARKERRAHAYDVHHAELKKLGIAYETKNAGHHVILLTDTKPTADFWPASGKFFLRRERRYGIGLHRLLKQLGIQS